MKNVYHKHEGIESKGKLKSHLVTVFHKDKQVEKWHNDEINKSKFSSKINTKIEIPKKLPSIGAISNLQIKIDNNNYAIINLDDLAVSGLKISFTRKENGMRRLVGLVIENEK